MSDVFDFNQTAASNTVQADGGAREGMDRSDVNNVLRDHAGAIRKWYEDAEWVDLLKESGGDFIVSRVSDDTFRVRDSAGADATSKFVVGTWCRVTGTGTPTVAFGRILTVGPYSAPNLDVVLELIVDAAYASADIPDTTVTQVSTYSNRRIRETAFSPIGNTVLQEPPEIPSIDDLGDGAALDMGTGNLFDADTVDGFEAQDFFDADALSHRNVLTNGAMAVWQRGFTIDGASEIPNDNNVYCADMWNLLSEVDDRWDISRERTFVPDGFRSALRMLSATGGGVEQAGIVQLIEGEDIREMVGNGKCSLSFYHAISSASDIANVRAGILEWRSPGVEDTALRGATGVVAPGGWNGELSNPTLLTNWTFANTVASISTGETWVRAEIPNITVNSANLNMAVLLWVDDDSYSVGKSVYFTGVQLEAGPAVTPYRHRSFGEEIGRCERYFATTYDYGTDPGTAVGEGALKHPSAGGTDYAADEVDIPWRYPTRMRTTPAVLIYSIGTGAVGKIRNSAAAADIDGTPADIGHTGCTIEVTGDPSKGEVWCHATADASL